MTRRLTSCTLVLLAAACGPELPELRYETEHLRIGTSFDVPLCRGDLDHYERVITTLEEVLGTTVEQPVDVYLWDLRESNVSPAGWCEVTRASGCYAGGVVFASQASIDHELVHAVIDSFAAPQPFWSEGAAMALQSNPTVFDWFAPIDNLDLDAPQLSYNAAGHFSRWVLETQGEQRYRELLRAPGSAREAFEHTYGMTVEAAQAQYFDESPHSYAAYITCDHAQLPSVGDLHWAETIDVDCAASDVHGISSGIGAYRVLTISAGGYHELSTSAESGVIARCRDQDLEDPIALDEPGYGDVPPVSGGFARVFAGGGAPTLLELAPGRYELAVGHAGHDARTVEVEVRAAIGPIPQTPESTQ